MGIASIFSELLNGKNLQKKIKIEKLKNCKNCSGSVEPPTSKFLPNRDKGTVILVG